MASVLPLICLLKKDEDPEKDTRSKKSIYFQIKINFDGDQTDTVFSEVNFKAILH